MREAEMVVFTQDFETLIKRTLTSIWRKALKQAIIESAIVYKQFYFISAIILKYSVVNTLGKYQNTESYFRNSFINFLGWQINFTLPFSI